jgi:type I restriction enzyme, R subunit
MTEFKQIVGRGTRVHSDTGKYYFTLMDFRGATNHFADPTFDGDPVQIYQPDRGVRCAARRSDAAPGDDGEGPAVVMIDPIDPGRRPSSSGGRHRGRRRKIYVDGVGDDCSAGGVPRRGWRLVTESLQGLHPPALHKRFASLDEFLRAGRRGSQAGNHRRTGEEGLRPRTILDELGKDSIPSTSSATWPSTPSRSPGRSERQQRPQARRLAGWRYRRGRCWRGSSPSTPTRAS